MYVLLSNSQAETSCNHVYIPFFPHLYVLVKVPICHQNSLPFSSCGFECHHLPATLQVTASGRRPTDGVFLFPAGNFARANFFDEVEAQGRD